MDFILSEKRKDVLVLIDRFGVITNHQLEKFLDYMGVNTIRRARKQLLELGFIDERVFGRRKVCAITKKGSEYVGKIMTAANNSYSNLQHDLSVNEVVFKLVNDYKNKGQIISFTTEREITREAFLSLSYQEINKPNKLRHLKNEVPDFVLLLNDTNRLAFEVELNAKSNKRIERKMKQYKESVANDVYSKVFYICKDEGIKRHVELFAKGIGIDIKFLMLNQLMDSEEV